jgi:hypothetical protein
VGRRKPCGCETRGPQHKREKADEKGAEQMLQLLRAYVLAGNPLPVVWILDPQTRDDREVVRARLDAAEKVVVVKAQIQGLLKRNRQTGPEGMKGANRTEKNKAEELF